MKINLQNSYSQNTAQSSFVYHIPSYIPSYTIGATFLPYFKRLNVHNEEFFLYTYQDPFKFTVEMLSDRYSTKCLTYL